HVLTRGIPMKSIKYLLLLLVLPFSAPASADLKVFACEPHWTALLAEVGGDHVSVTTASGAFNDPHFIQARPSLISAMRKADLVVCNGADLEVGWLPVLMQQGARDTVQPGQLGFLDASQSIQM